MTPIQQLMLGVGAKKKTYMDDVFSTYLYKGDGGGNRHIDNGIDINGEGGLVLVNRREGGQYGGTYVGDTARGLGKQLFTAGTDGEVTVNRIKPASGSNTGFNVNNDSDVNSSSNTYASWSFRKAPGFFDVVTYSGTGSAQNISHSLGCIPGMILIKCTSSSENWLVYHRETSATHALFLNNTNAANQHSNYWNDTEPTSTQFTVKAGGESNDSGKTYVAYLFAGGESTAATARSVDFDGSNDYLQIADSSNDLSFAVNCTIEMWIKPDDWGIGSGNQVRTLWSGDADNTYGHGCINISKNSSGINVRIGNNNSSDSLMTYTGELPPIGQWTHIALVRNTNVAYLYINGTLGTSTSVPTNRLYNTGNVRLGYSADTSASGYTQAFNGKISNVRFTKSAVYTSSFKPTYEPLTNITNTELLCCNNSSVTGSTVTSGTITSSGGPTASTDSPFDDPAGFAFGDAGDQNVVKCGSYTGNGSTTGPEINLGWEPQWVMIKWTASASGNVEGWHMFDSMRGIVTGEKDPYILANTSGSESTGSDGIDLTPTGFKVTNQNDFVNNNGTSYVYLAIRRPDGYVGKPVETGTDVFTMDTGNSSSTIPTFDSGFPVDMALRRTPASSMSCWLSTRLQGPKDLGTASGYNGSESTDTNSYTWDSNAGWASQSGWGSSQQSWMWKRHAGFDVVSYKGNNSSHNEIPHSLGKTPEMIWLKARDRTESWVVYHKGLNGGTNPHTYYLQLNGNGAESSWNWSDSTPPTSTHFTVSSGASINFNENYLALLFASVPGVSSVGYFSGSDSSHTITTGFQPRWVLFKNMTSNTQWVMVDTTRGWTNGSQDWGLYLSHPNAHTTSNIGHPVSNGFYLDGDNSEVSKAGSTHLYYAHA